jgi:hypothetical protein
MVVSMSASSGCREVDEADVPGGGDDPVLDVARDLLSKMIRVTDQIRPLS